MKPKKTNIIVRNANDFKNYVDYVAELEQRYKKQKEVIDKLNKYLSESQLTRSVKGTRIYDGINANYEIRNILKEVE